MINKIQKVILFLVCILCSSTIASGQVQDNSKLWESWERVGELPFSRRDGVGVVHFNGELWMMGGWVHGPVVSEIYKSSDGINWEFVTVGEWPGRHGAGMVAFNDRLWVLSGDGHTDVWSSADGIHWVQEVEVAPWGKRYAPYIAVFNNKIWLMGGISFWDEAGNFSQEYEHAFNDVWSSADGIHWIKEVDEAPWGPRGLIHGSLIHNGELWIIGGGSKYWNWPTLIYNDAWKSKNGIDWEFVSDNNPWVPRIHFSTISFDNKIWIMDGTTNDTYLNNDVWYSEEGEEWFELNGTTKFPAIHASTFFVHDSDLYVASGLGLEAIYRYKTPVAQTIVLDSAITVPLNDNLTEFAYTLSSGLVPVYHVQDTSIAEIVEGQRLRAKKVGKTRIGVSHPGHYGFYSLDTLFINLSVKLNQLIIAEVLPEAKVQDTLKVNIQVLAGLPVRIDSGEGYQVIDDTTIVPTTTGEINLMLSQDGDDNFLDWSQVLTLCIYEGNLATVTKEQQALLNATSLISTEIGSSPLDLGLISSSGLPLTIQVLDTNIAEVTLENLIAIKDTGTTKLIVSNQGNASYFPLYTTLIELVVNKKPQYLIGSESTISAVYGETSIELDFTSTSGLPLSYAILDTSVAEILTDNMLLIKRAGKTGVTITNAGNRHYLPLDTRVTNLEISKREQTVYAEAPTEVLVKDTVVVKVQSNAGLPVRIVPNKSIVILSDSSFIVRNVGQAAIELAQEGDLNHNSWSSTINMMVHSSKDFLVYPNPARDFVQIYVNHSRNTPKEIRVTGATGRVMKTIPVFSAVSVYTLNIHDLVQGVYYMTVLYEDGSLSTSKFFKD